MRQTVRGWHLQLKCDRSLEDLSRMFDPVLRGWANYYGRFHGSALRPLWYNVNAYLARWLMRKYKHLTKRRTQAFREIARLASASPSAFVHWQLGVHS
jgi:RNA-directed DNA polymerase